MQKISFLDNALSRTRHNLVPGLIVALVNIPLSLSLAIAAHATPVMGILTAIWAGLVASILGGSRYNVIGPTGALSGLLASYAILFGIESLPLLALLSGLIILIFTYLRIDRYITFIPSSVIHGFTLGIACIIALNQMNFALGLSGMESHPEFIRNVFASVMNIGGADWQSVAVFGVSLGSLFLLLRFSPRLPGPIIIFFLGILFGYLSSHDVASLHLQTLSTKYGGIDMPLAHMFSTQDISWSPTILKGAFSIAVIAMLETLLSAKIADGMTGTKFDQRREMFGLGFANIASGLLGGIPATAALARTALNIKSGADSRLAALFNALFVLLIGLLLFPMFRYLPLSVVGAILVYVAVRMIETEHFQALYHFDKYTFWLSIGVAVITVAWDPMIGILTGAALSLLMFVQQLSKGQSEISMHKNGEFIARIPHSKLREFDQHGDVVIYRIAGEMTYFNGRSHAETIKRLKGCHTIVMSLRNLFYLDIDGREVLGEIVMDGQQAGRTVMVSGASDAITFLLEQTGWFRALEKRGHVFANAREALSATGC